MSTTVESEWLSAREAAGILGCDQRRLPRLASMGLLTAKRVPLAWPRYLRSDVERLAQDSITPASACAPRAEAAAC